MHLTPNIRVGDVAKRPKVDARYELATSAGQNDDLVVAILSNSIETIDKVRVVVGAEEQRPAIRVQFDQQHALSVASHAQALVGREIVRLSDRLRRLREGRRSDWHA